LRRAMGLCQGLATYDERMADAARAMGMVLESC
jgi:hypothetical protein